MLKLKLVTVLQGRARLRRRFSEWLWSRHLSLPCFPCLWGVLLPTRLLVVLGKITVKTLLYFKCCHKNAKDGACGILFGDGEQSQIEVQPLDA